MRVIHIGIAHISNAFILYAFTFAHKDFLLLYVFFGRDTFCETRVNNIKGSSMQSKSYKMF